jgi:hypothetical protein
MKLEPSALTKSPSAGCESENIQIQPATWEIGAEYENANTAPLPQPPPKPPPSFYEAIYYWLMARP